MDQFIQRHRIPGTEDRLARLDPASADARALFPNVQRLTKDDAVVWTAELPVKHGYDAYTSIEVSPQGELLATSWSGYRVQLDFETGRIMRREFTK